MPIAYGIGGVVNVPAGALSGNGPPPSSLQGQLGQAFQDKSTTPPTLYFWNGQSWATGGDQPATTTTYGTVLLDTDTTLAGADNDHVPTALATKTYADNLAIAGAPISEESVNGIGQLATDAEAVAGTANNPGVTALFVTPSNLSPVFAAPPAIGGTTPAGAAFTSLSASGAFALTGDTVDVAEGGTGASSLTDHGLLIGSGTGAVTASAVGTNNQILIGQTGADPIWTTNVDLPGTLDVTGAATLDSTLDVAGAATAAQLDVDNISINGNTISSTDTNGDINLTPDGSGQVVIADLALTTPLAATEGGTGLTTITDHGVMVGSGTGAVTPLTVGTNGQVLVGSSAADPVFATIASSDSSITVAAGAGTLGLTVTAAGESQVGGLETATDAEAVAVTATDKIVVPSNLGPVFAAPPAIGGTTPSTAEFTTVTVADINADYTDHGVILGQGTDTNLVATAAGTNGQLFVGSTGADPAFATATSTNSSIAYTLGAGSINLDVDESYLQTASVTIATGDVLTLATTPVELVAAPGAGKYIEFLSAQFILDYNSIAYTESGDNLGIKYTNAAGVQVSSTIECTGFIDQSADTITNAVPASDVIVAASAADNAALVLDNLGSNFAAGNSPLIVKVSYRVITSGL